MLIPSACLKRYFLKVLQRLSQFVQHYQSLKSSPSGNWQNRVFCPSIQQSLYQATSRKTSPSPSRHGLPVSLTTEGGRLVPRRRSQSPSNSSISDYKSYKSNQISLKIITKLQQNLVKSSNYAQKWTSGRLEKRGQLVPRRRSQSPSNSSIKVTNQTIGQLISK